MHKVIDFGSLNSEALKEFFSSSLKNFGVVIDMLVIESLKRKGLENHRQSFGVIAGHVDRVFVLKPSGVAARLRPDTKKFPNKLIFPRATAAFPGYCIATVSGSIPGVVAQISAKQDKARSFVDGVTANIEMLREAILGT